MRRRPREAKPVWDADIGGFRLEEPPAPRPAGTAEEKRATARASVSHLLAESFGMKTSRNTAGLNVPAHLRKYVK
jgi:hypothetical protein